MIKIFGGVFYSKKDLEMSQRSIDILEHKQEFKYEINENILFINRSGVYGYSGATMSPGYIVKQTIDKEKKTYTISVPTNIVDDGGKTTSKIDRVFESIPEEDIFKKQ